MSTVESVVGGYCDAWTNGDMTKARTFLADDLDFQDSVNRFQTADAFIEALAQFYAIFNEARFLKKMHDDDSAFLLYDCSIKTPGGALRCAEYFRVANGKIREIRLVFDATELNRLKAAVPPAR